MSDEARAAPAGRGAAASAEAALEALLSRQSVPPLLLEEPAPDDAELEELLAAAVCAPDHGAIRPWRFLVIRGAARERLGEIFAAALRARVPDADAEAQEKERQRPLRAPLLVAVCVETMPGHPKVPVVEQLLTGGAAAQNLLNALHLRGYGAIMLTGDNAHDERVKAALGLAEKDAIVGFVYVGTPGQPLRPKKRPPVARFLRHWTGAPTETAHEG